MIDGKIHKLVLLTQQGSGKKFEAHNCGTGEKYGIRGTYDNKKVTCKKCLNLIK